MTSTLVAIAFLCQINGGEDYVQGTFWRHKEQNQCQKALSLCMVGKIQNSTMSYDYALLNCLAERKTK